MVTDKKGSYVHDLTQKDFKVFEDNKEQSVASFSAARTWPSRQQPQKHYLILFFDNSSMAPPDQIQARAAAKKFIDGQRRARPHDGGGRVRRDLRIVQNFTANADLLRAADQARRVRR